MIRQLSVLVLGFGMIAAGSGCSDPQPMRVMTFNIRFGTANDGDNRWENRREVVINTIKNADPDIIGVQEALDFQVEELAEALPEYGWIGVGRDDGVTKGEFAPIFYRKSRFTLQRYGTFWLSDKPEEAGSVGWDAALPRIVTWTQLQPNDVWLEELHVLNTHFDHRGREARLRSAQLIRRHVEMVAGSPVVLLGDFNALPGSRPYRALTEDTGNLAELHDPLASFEPDDPSLATFHGFDGEADAGRIDWILFNRQVEPIEAWVDQYNEDGRYPSDHYPVVADVRIVDRR